MTSGERLVVVSNRLPLTLRHAADGWRTQRSAGGLATAMGPLLKRSHGIWIGWHGCTTHPKDPERRNVIQRWEEADQCIAVDISAELAHQYYEGYANQTIWPLFHQFPSRFVFTPTGWNAYVEANRLFRDAVLRRLQPGDLIWVHDYHLMLLPQMLREAAPDARIGFFLHIPFPSSEVLRILPRREELLAGLLGADYLAFHTHSYVQHLRTSLLRILGLESRMDGVEAGQRFVRVEALPLGIPADEFLSLLETDKATRNRLEELQRRFEGRRILLSVDRLDYTKGIPERLRTYRRLLREAPDLRRKVVLIQIAVPSREAIPEYQALGRDVNRLVGEINGEFGSADWTPVIYIRRGIARSELVALYAAAEVAWITPLRDGMNLVAKEYVACQKNGHGVLVLSEFTGAAAEMGEAILVNPYDEERTAAAVQRALSMPDGERRERMSALHRRIVRNNVFAWGERFVNNLRQAATGSSARSTVEPQPLPADEVVTAFNRAKRRVLLLDYDGTLVGFANRPVEASPPAGVVQLVSRLANGKRNHVAIVSGRARTDLQAWFGHVSRLWLFGEHGAAIRPAGARRWRSLGPRLPEEWKNRVLPVLEHMADRTPGSFVEEKEHSLVWHYRMADPRVGEWLANELVAMLEGMLADTQLRPVRGKKSVEVRPMGANKREVMARIQARCSNPDFIFAAGDDRTDEDLFELLREPDCWTVRVGGGSSIARFRLPDQQTVRQLLERFCATS